MIVTSNPCVSCVQRSSGSSLLESAIIPGGTTITFTGLFFKPAKRFGCIESLRMKIRSRVHSWFRREPSTTMTRLLDAGIHQQRFLCVGA